MNYVHLADGSKVSAQPIVTKSPDSTPVSMSSDAVVVDLDAAIHPALSGLGGAFNEQGGDAVDGMGVQYCDAEILSRLRNTYPELKLMHTEGHCRNGNNSMKQARTRFQEAKHYLYAGCENYCYWNMVLNEDSKSA